jgi:hypothetical protein
MDKKKIKVLKKAVKEEREKFTELMKEVSVAN